jgi:3-deoxy-D-manno-octulosonic acid kinase
VSAALRPPVGLVAADDAGGAWWVEPETLAALRGAGWLDPTRIETALGAASGARGRAAVAVVPIGAAALVLRGVHHGGWLGAALGRGLGSARRPLAEIAATARLRAAGAPVPRPAFAGAWRHGSVWRGVVATHLEAGAHDAVRWLRESSNARRAIESAARAVRRFHDAGGWHADLHAGNLLVRDRGGALDVLVIDLDRARVEERVDARARMAQLMRLYRSLVKRDLVDRIGPRGCAAFLHAYVAGDRALRAAMLERLPAEQRRIALHALLYRSA